MNGDFIRKEWGAVTFVLTVLVGMVVVPLALYFANQGPSPIALPTPSCVASGASTASGSACSASTAR